MLDLQDPLTHASDLRQHVFLCLMQAHNAFETDEPFLAGLAHGAPFFSSFSQLV